MSICDSALVSASASSLSLTCSAYEFTSGDFADCITVCVVTNLFMGRSVVRLNNELVNIKVKSISTANASALGLTGCAYVHAILVVACNITLIALGIGVGTSIIVISVCSVVRENVSKVMSISKLGSVSAYAGALYHTVSTYELTCRGLAVIYFVITVITGFCVSI